MLNVYYFNLSVFYHVLGHRWPNKRVQSYILGRPVYTDTQLHSHTQIAKFMGPTWGPPGSCRPQMGPMLAPWTLLLGYACRQYEVLMQITKQTRIISPWAREPDNNKEIKSLPSCHCWYLAAFYVLSLLFSSVAPLALKHIEVLQKARYLNGTNISRT